MNHDYDAELVELKAALPEAIKNEGRWFQKGRAYREAHKEEGQRLRQETERIRARIKWIVDPFA